MVGRLRSYKFYGNSILLGSSIACLILASTTAICTEPDWKLIRDRSGYDGMPKHKPKLNNRWIDMTAHISQFGRIMTFPIEVILSLSTGYTLDPNGSLGRYGEFVGFVLGEEYWPIEIDSLGRVGYPGPPDVLVDPVNARIVKKLIQLQYPELIGIRITHGLDEDEAKAWIDLQRKSLGSELPIVQLPVLDSEGQVDEMTLKKLGLTLQSFELLEERLGFSFFQEDKDDPYYEYATTKSAGALIAEVLKERSKSEVILITGKISTGKTIATRQTRDVVKYQTVVIELTGQSATQRTLTVHSGDYYRRWADIDSKRAVELIEKISRDLIEPRERDLGSFAQAVVVLRDLRSKAFLELKSLYSRFSRAVFIIEDAFSEFRSPDKNSPIDLIGGVAGSQDFTISLMLNTDSDYRECDSILDKSANQKDLGEK